MCVGAPVHVRIQRCVCAQVCVRACACLCLLIYAGYVCVGVCACVHLCICVCTLCARVCVCVCGVRGARGAPQCVAHRSAVCNTAQRSAQRVGHRTAHQCVREGARAHVTVRVRTPACGQVWCAPHAWPCSGVLRRCTRLIIGAI
jgi:hypothetical protein